MNRRLKLATLLAIPVLSLGLLARSRHGVLVLSHYVGGRTGTCSLSESFEGEALSSIQVENQATLKAASAVIGTDGNLTLWRTEFGDFWVPTPSGDAVIFDMAEQKRRIYGSRTGVRSGDIVLDAGANVGVFTRVALQAGAHKVVAIEPAPENLECLRRNFRAEIAAGTVVVYPKGVWDRDDVLRLAVDPNNSARDSFVRVLEGAQYVEAPLTTIDKLVEELELPRVDLIKMDIEGAERKAITGGRRTIAQYHPRMALCVYHVDGDDTEVPRLVREIHGGYKIAQTCLLGTDRVQPEVAFFY